MSGYVPTTVATMTKFSALSKECEKFWAISRLHGPREDLMGGDELVLPTHRKARVSLSTVFSHLTFISALWDEVCRPSLEMRKPRHRNASKTKHLGVVEIGVQYGGSKGEQHPSGVISKVAK